MTVRQMVRVRAILEDVRTARRHPSLAVRARASVLSDAEIAAAEEAIASIMEADDGHRAWGLIEAWKRGDVNGAVRWLVHGTGPMGK